VAWAAASANATAFAYALIAWQLNLPLSVIWWPFQ
jgi:hypothetical protein